MNILYMTLLSISLLSVSTAFSSLRPKNPHTTTSMRTQGTINRPISPQAAAARKKSEQEKAFRRAKALFGKNPNQAQLNYILALLNHANQNDVLVQRLRKQVIAKIGK